VFTTVSGLPVLIVEDDPSLREHYRSVLRQAGFWALTVEDGFAALRCVEDRRVAAVVLDLVLPRLSGRDVLHEMKARPDTRNIPIIVVSGHDVSDLKESDFSCVLRKPVTPDTLVAAVQRCISGSGGLHKPQRI
jgi:DNA-binding response OmpR family regulator